MEKRKVLDVCCGGRMFWFDKSDNRAIFVDRRKETHMLKDASVKTGERNFSVWPDIQADFTALPFPADYFSLVVFDPPHRVSNGGESWMHKKYGTLQAGWQEMLRAGFGECFRVLAPSGTLIFKWSEYHIQVASILALIPERPLFGHRSGKRNKTHWLTFAKPNNACTQTAEFPVKFSFIEEDDSESVSQNFSSLGRRW